LQGGNLKEKNSRGVTQNSPTLQGGKDLLTLKLNMKKTFINNNGDKIIIGTLLDVFLIETTELKYRIVEPLF
jgi:hypothetical protein